MSRAPLATALAGVLLLAACGGEEVVAETSTSLVVPTAVETTTTTLPATTVDTTDTTAPVTATTVEEVTTTTDPDQADVGIEVLYRLGEASVAQDRYQVTLGSQVDILIDSDSPVEIHVHGYDILFPVDANSPTVIRFEATIPGIFEVELEGAHQLLFELEVS